MVKDTIRIESDTSRYRDAPRRARSSRGLRYTEKPFVLDPQPRGGNNVAAQVHGRNLGRMFGAPGDPSDREVYPWTFLRDAKYVAPEWWNREEIQREKEEKIREEQERRKDIKKEATVKEPPGRNEPKGGSKKPRGRGGGGRSFGGPNSGDEVDDDKGKKPSGDSDIGDEGGGGNFPEPGGPGWGGDTSMPDPRDYPVKNDGNWWMMIFFRLQNNYFWRQEYTNGSYKFWERYETDWGLEVIKDGLDVLIRWKGQVMDRESHKKSDGTVYIEEAVSSVVRYGRYYPLRPYYSPTEAYEHDDGYWTVPSQAEYYARTPLLGNHYHNGRTGRRSDCNVVWTKDPESILAHIDLWTVKEADRPTQPLSSNTSYYWNLGYHTSGDSQYWYPVDSIRETSSSNVYSIHTYTRHASYTYKLWILSEDKEFHPPTGNIREITIPDMNDEQCCGMIRRIYEFLDPESFPAQMPSKITVDADNPDNGIKEIKTLPEWLMYRFDIDDERWGEFEVKVEIDDVNLITKEEEQATIKLPNLAESIAELFGMVMEIAISHQVTQNAVLTCLHEAGLAHAAAFKAGREVSEILDYIGFETEEKYEKLKTAFTPEAESFEELLEPNESKIKITNQKNAKETLQTTLNQIKEIFSIVRAQGTLQVNGNDPSKDILADLNRLYDSMKRQDDIREQETNKVKELLKKDFPDIDIKTELIDGDNPLRGTL